MFPDGAALSVIDDEIARHGPIPFSRFQELALYHPEFGFYASGGFAGKNGDFITSPELGPLFAEVVANALDDWWQQLGSPAQFWVFEAGAGAGTLAKGIIEAEPKCLSVMRYVMVEQSAGLRRLHSTTLPIVSPEVVFSSHRSLVASAPLVTSIAELPSGKFEELTGVVLANELLDNLPVDLYVRREHHWYQCLVDRADDGSLVERTAPFETSSRRGSISARLDRLVPDAPNGARVPWQEDAQAWLQSALRLLWRGRVICVDYAKTTAWMSTHDWTHWMRTYREHMPGVSPFDAPGNQDITCEVAVDQLAWICPPILNRSQAEFLTAHGLDALVDIARERWHENASAGNLEAFRSRSRIGEALALTDEAGLGGHRVIEWNVDPRSRS